MSAEYCVSSIGHTVTLEPLMPSPSIVTTLPFTDVYLSAATLNVSSFSISFCTLLIPDSVAVSGM